MPETVQLPTRENKRYLHCGMISSFCLPLAWLLIGTVYSAILAWISIILLLPYISDRRGSYAEFFLLWFFSHCAGFYWVWNAIAVFSQGDVLLVSLFFLLFIIINTTQFPAFFFVYRHLPLALEKFALRSAIAWVAVEAIPVRILPWCLGHTQLSMLPLIQVADLGGAIFISFLMFWSAESIFLVLFKKRNKSVLSYAIIILIAANIYGFYRLTAFSAEKVDKIGVALVQANPQEKVEGVAGFLDMTKLKELSERAMNEMPIDLVIWPERSLPIDINESIFNRKYEPRLPSFSSSVNLLTGAATNRRPHKLFNSAMLIRSDGFIPLPYHKRELMPFGEYIPFKEYFPWLTKINPEVEILTPGEDRKVFEVGSVIDQNIKAHVAPLICYEDVKPLHAREAVLRGADLLVGMSNDSWLQGTGTIGMHQHNTIAAFRAIENRRSFVRVALTGITTVINSAGVTVKVLPEEVEGFLTTRVGLHKQIALYTRIGDWPWHLISGLVFSFLLSSLLIKALLRFKEYLIFWSRKKGRIESDPGFQGVV